MNREEGVVKEEKFNEEKRQVLKDIPEEFHDFFATHF